MYFWGNTQCNRMQEAMKKRGCLLGLGGTRSSFSSFNNTSSTQYWKNGVIN